MAKLAPSKDVFSKVFCTVCHGMGLREALTILSRSYDIGIKSTKVGSDAY